MASAPGQQQSAPISQPPLPPGSQQQPTPSTTTIPTGPSSSSVLTNDPNALSWEGDRMFNIYIYDYCNKRGFRKTAKELLAEAEIAPDAQPPINARQGLLFEWWSVFWVLFTAKNNKTGPEDAMIYIENQNQQSVMRQHRQMEARQNQPSQVMSQPPGAGSNGAIQGRVGPAPPAPNGMPPQGGMPPRNMPNGVGPVTIPPPGPGFQPGQQPPQPQPHLMNGMQPNSGPGSGPGPGPGPNPGQPPNPPFGQRPPGPPNQPPNPNPNPRPGQPGQQPYQSPPTAHSPPGSSQGQPLQQRNPAGPQPHGMIQSPHMGPRGSIGAPGQPGPGILPHPQGPHGQQGQQGPGSGYPMGGIGNPGMNMGGMGMGMGGMSGAPGMGPNMGVGRSPSRSGDGGPGQQAGMNPSPSLANRQTPGTGGGMGMMGGPMGGPMAGSMMNSMGMPGNMMGGGMGLAGGPMMSDSEIQNILLTIPQHLVLNVKRDANVENKDVSALSLEEKRQVVHIYRTRYANRPHGGPPMPQNLNNPGMGPGPSNMGPPQGQPPGAPSQGHTPRMQPGRVAGKRNSATGEDPDSNNTSSPPDNKRRKKSPPESNTPQNSQQQSPSNYPAQVPGQGLGHNPGSNPGPGPMGRPIPNPGFQNSQPPPNTLAYRNQMASVHKHQMPQMSGGPTPHMEGGGVGPFNGRKPPGMMAPPQSPGMNKDQVKDGIKAEGSPRNLPGQNQGMTPTNPGTATSTPVLSHQPVPPPGPSLLNSQPTPQSQGPTPQPGMPGPSSLLTTPLHQPPQQPPSVTDMFSNEFMQSVANQLEDFDSNLFRPDGDINFERDFGQWFNNPDDVGAMDMKP